MNSRSSTNKGLDTKHLLALFLVILQVSQIQAQTNIQTSDDILLKGEIVDEVTGEVLPAAHIMIKNTYKGTIANSDGQFSLAVSNLPITLIARYVGYETLEIEITANNPILLALQPAVLDLQEVIITEDDPALFIMEQVIKRKIEWRSNLSRYQANAYTRQQLKRDTAIVSISESLSEVYWDKEKGTREILKSKRQTANMDQASNFAGVSYTPNFYDDNLDITGFNMVGITHPDALDFYAFKLLDYSSIDDKIVYEIEVSPRRNLQPLFTGTIQVLDEEFSLLSVRLKPNEVVVFPPPIQNFNLYYEQQYSNFGGEFWLPVDFRLEGQIEIGLPGLKFPPIGFKQISRLSDYVVNDQVPSHIFLLENSFTVDSVAMQSSDSLFVRSLDVVPLSSDEVSAYSTLDSTATLEKSFQPTGFLAKYVNMEDEDSSSDSTSTHSEFLSKATSLFTSELRYNRVDALYLGLGLNYDFTKDDRFNFQISRGYSFGYQEWSYSLTSSYQWDPEQTRNRLWFGMGSETESRLARTFYPSIFLSIPVLLGFEDYNDYYRLDYTRFGLQGRFDQRFVGRRLHYNLYYSREVHNSIDFKTSYDLRGLNNVARINQAVEEGTYSSVIMELEGGSGKEALGVIEADNVFLRVETAHSALGSDRDFTRFEMEIFQRFETFYQRRLIPNVLDLRFHAGTYLGDLPVQKNGVLDASLGVYSPFGVFKTKTFTPYEGASYASIYAEHNFRSIPLEAMGWRSAGKKGLSLIVFGGAGKTWDSHDQTLFIQQVPGSLLKGTNGVHTEVGFSLSNLFSLFRIDFAYRLDEPGFYPGISLSRLF
jgi:type IV secretory pathway VirB3-like protein